MRGADVTQEGLFVTRQTADYVPAEHPLRQIRDIINRALRDLDLLFESIYEDWGRPSVPPERLLRGLVLQALYGLRCHRGCCREPRAARWPGRRRAAGVSSGRCSRRSRCARSTG
jgi:hypothetical protein